MTEQDERSQCIAELLAALQGVYPSARVWVRCMELAYTQGRVDAARAIRREAIQTYTDVEAMA